jgi:Mg-chelatase subunit ChlD
MSDFQITFTYPLLLLLAIPAIGIALIPYLKVEKKYRRTRNRVCSIVLHSVIVVCCVLVLAGIQFTYQIPNENNEIILLVDVSDTQEQSKTDRDSFVETIITSGKYDNFKMGVVTFGFDQVYAVPLTNDLNTVYNEYLTAELPDVSGTDIAAALTYTKGLFNNPQSGKIVLITDGKETDEDASTIVKAVAAGGVNVDVVYISSTYGQSDVQICGVELPEYHVSVGDECSISVSLQSNSGNTATLKMTDNETLTQATTVSLAEGLQTFSFNYKFTTEGMHELVFVVEANGDNLTQNNTYYAYFNLEVFKNVLIIEQAEESAALKELLTTDELYDVTVLNLRLDDDIPTTVQELCDYDEIILNNIAYKDMPDGFDDLLYSYVYDYGGGVFTVGGNDSEGNANAYNRSDLYGTTYQSMLPVEAINYTPPVAVMVIIDRSGSMGDSFGDEGKTKLDYARAGAAACLDALTERDYFGLMTLDSGYSTILPLTERTKDREIRSAIESINVPTGGTVFPGAINRAGEALRRLTNVAKRHIIVVTDGEVPSEQAEQYLEYIDNYYTNDGITLSVVGIGVSTNSEAAASMTEAVEKGHGRLHAIDNSNSESLIREMREDLNVKEIKEVNYTTFNPTVSNSMSLSANNLMSGITLNGSTFPATLDGFYGVKVKDEKYLVLVGDYNVPIYAQWKLGNGTVGSFMCDLSGSAWSSDFMSSEAGVQFIYNVVEGLLPVYNIKPSEFTVDLKEENYINQLSIYADLQEGETMQGQILDVNGNVVLSLNSLLDEKSEGYDSNYFARVALTQANNYSRCTFVVKKGGIYQIVLNKCDAQGNVLATYSTYKEFSYSGEYDNLNVSSEAELLTKLNAIADGGGGKVILDYDNLNSIFESFVVSIHQAYDPDFILILLAIVLFLLDLLVRKFKFRWPHEIIRDRNMKRNLSANAEGNGQTGKTAVGSDGKHLG